MNSKCPEVSPCIYISTFLLMYNKINHRPGQYSIHSIMQYETILYKNNVLSDIFYYLQQTQHKLLSCHVVYIDYFLNKIPGILFLVG